jgi:hypothetical protein
VAGVKVEIDDEKLAGGEGVTARFELVSPAINGDNREKTQKQRNFFMARWRDDGIARGISRCRFMPESLATLLRIRPEGSFVWKGESRRRDADGGGRDDRAPQEVANALGFAGEKHWQRNGRRATKSLRMGVLINRKETCLTDCYRNVTFVAMLRMELASQPV